MTRRGCSWLSGETKRGRFVSPKLIISLGFVIIVSRLSGMDLEIGVVIVQIGQTSSYRHRKPEEKNEG